MREVRPAEFDIYALSLPHGHGFGQEPPVGAWMSDDGVTLGVLRQHDETHRFGFLIMRRRIDQVWTIAKQQSGITTKDEAQAKIETELSSNTERAPLPSGVSPRPALNDLQGRSASDVFNMLRRPTHLPAAWILNQVYLALPNPDKNWAGDCQTSNFHTRLWEAQLLASFREQGLLVEQPFEAPDFKIENRNGDMAWIEAVTANPAKPYNHVNAPPTAPPAEKRELFFGEAAVRFAKTLGNKIGKNYTQLGHVSGQPFVLAIADFHAPASMLWSREALIGYLYGFGAEAVNVDGTLRAVEVPTDKLLGKSEFPAGLFRDDQHADISAIIFTNACSLSKFNRIGITGHGAPRGYRYTRFGDFFDRTPGALKGIPFCLDITSDEYRSLWPHGYEPWSAELEVFHNPFAQYPVPLELVPEATHWFDQDGEKVCSSVYEHLILWSTTVIQNEQDRPFSLNDLEKQKRGDR